MKLVLRPFREVIVQAMVHSQVLTTSVTGGVFQRHFQAISGAEAYTIISTIYSEAMSVRMKVFLCGA
jgi:hypothetical protein